jgi:menaquinone-dependent protoporphyrinogen oxidase
MGKKVLVAYGSWCGSTEEVAQAIGDTLAKDGAEVDVLPASQVRGLGDYGAVVVGTAIRAGRCVGEVNRFVRENGEALRQIPVALFSVGLAPTDKDPEKGQADAAKFLEHLREALHPVSVGLFAGVVDAARAKFPMKLVVRAMPQGDFRNWDAIRAWAESLLPSFRG